VERASGDDGQEDDLLAFRAPLPPDDRLWRHPSELAWQQSASTPPPSAPPRRGWPLALVSGLCGSVLTVGLLAVTGVLAREPGVREVVVREAVAPARAGGGAGGLAGVAARAADWVVRIAVSGEEPGVGSGVVIRDDGHVLTNAHVVEGASRIHVHLADGRTLDGTLVGVDDETDLAVVRVDADGPLPVAVLGSVDDVSVGDQAIAVGSPLGLQGGPSVTSGIVSGLGRLVESQDGMSLLDMIQTDAAIAPGSSGGALLDGRGVLVGITTAFAVTDAGAEGLGFATPVDVARAVADDIVEHGEARPCWLGVKGDDTVGGGGAHVDEVLDASPAAAAGFEAGDVVVAIDRREIGGMSALRIALRRHRPGAQVVVTVERDGERLRLPVVLEARPAR
jgi:S1-C subfamily serine protease